MVHDHFSFTGKKLPLYVSIVVGIAIFSFFVFFYLLVLSYVGFNAVSHARSKCSNRVCIHYYNNICVKFRYAGYE